MAGRGMAPGGDGIRPKTAGGMTSSVAGVNHMHRRRFLREGVAAGVLAAGAGGFLFVRRGQARAAVAAGLLADALPPLAATYSKELNALPARGREEIQRYFHGRCVNVEGFVSHVCSDAFAERLGLCRTPDEREGCVLHAFFGRVATEAEILNQVQTTAAEVGRELDAAWDAYCAETSAKWDARVRGDGPVLAAGELADRLGATVRAELEQAARQPLSAGRRPAVGETIGKIGESAVLLLPVVRYGQLGLQVGIPVFFLFAAKHVWDYVLARLDDRRGDCQAAISGRLALLGNRVGAEFEQELRRRLTDLHTWREGSVRAAADRLAEERVGWI